MSTDEVLDPAAVAELCRAQEHYGNPAFIRQLVELFRNSAPGKLDRIREALAGGDAGTIERVAHILKTNCAVLGAARMAAACGRMEEAASRAAFDQAEAAFSEAEAQFPAVLAAVSALGDRTTIV